METLETKMKKQIEDLEQFILNVSSDMRQLCDKLGWSLDNMLDRDKGTFVTCPIDSNHRVPSTRLDEHVKKCHTRPSASSQQQDVSSSAFSSPFPAIHVHNEELREILPIVQRGNEGQSPPFNLHVDDLTQPQKLLLYEFVSSKAKQVGALSVNVDISKLDISHLNANKGKDPVEQKPKSQLEFLAEMRDFKRRRQRHRAENPASQRSQYDVTRELIETQMILLGVKPEVFDTSSLSVRSDREKAWQRGTGVKMVALHSGESAPMKHNSSQSEYVRKQIAGQKSDRSQHDEQVSSDSNRPDLNASESCRDHGETTSQRTVINRQRSNRRSRSKSDSSDSRQYFRKTREHRLLDGTSRKGHKHSRNSSSDSSSSSIDSRDSEKTKEHGQKRKHRSVSRGGSKKSRKHKKYKKTKKHKK